MSMISVNNICKSFSGKRVLNDVSFNVEKNEVVGLLGPNAAGKTTTLRIISGFFPPSSGQVLIDNKDMEKHSYYLRSIIGYMPESVPIYPELRVIEYLKFRASLKDIPKHNFKKRLSYVIERCQLEDVSRKIIGTLSKGFKQRVGLADALLSRPSILILDEPTSGLDPEQIIYFRTLLKEIATESTIIVSTHILAEAEKICDRLVIINEGSIRAIGSKNELISKYGLTGNYSCSLSGNNNEIKEFFQNINDIKIISCSNAKNNILEFSFKLINNKYDLSSIPNTIIQNGWKLFSFFEIKLSIEEIFLRIISGKL